MVFLIYKKMHEYGFQMKTIPEAAAEGQCVCRLVKKRVDVPSVLLTINTHTHESTERSQLTEENSA